MNSEREHSPQPGRVVERGHLEVRSERRDEVEVVTPAGEVDIAVTDLLDQEMRRAEASDARTIVLDLSRLDFIDGAGIHLLVKLRDRSRGDGNRLRIRRGAEHVTRLFRITGVEEELPLVA